MYLSVFHPLTERILILTFNADHPDNMVTQFDRHIKARLHTSEGLNITLIASQIIGTWSVRAEKPSRSTPDPVLTRLSLGVPPLRQFPPRWSGSVD